MPFPKAFVVKRYITNKRAQSRNLFCIDIFDGGVNVGIVPYANSVVALNTFQANGATQVQLIDPYPAGNHTTGALPCYQAARAWFDLLKN